MLLVGGGTGGHISPLLAVAEAVADLAPDARFLFVGGRRGLEAEIVPAAGLPFHATPFPSLRDPGSRLSLLTRGLLLPVAAVDALWHVARFRPSVCLTSGGAVAFPVVLAASALGVPVALWTGDVVPGRANRALARWASRIAAAFPGAEPYFKKGRVEVTGNPIRRSLLRWTRAEGRRHLGIADDEKVVLVTGGSQGSARINEAVGAALPRLLARATVLHHVGPANVARAEARRGTLTGEQRERYRPFGFLKDDMGAAIAAADVVVGRAGSSSIAEPLAFGVPLVLIPFAAAASGHQEANARAVVEQGAAAMVKESELSSDRLEAVVVGLLNDPARLERMSAAAKKAGRPDAAPALARSVLALGGCTG